jgi:hypothetical protein
MVIHPFHFFLDRRIVSHDGSEKMGYALILKRSILKYQSLNSLKKLFIPEEPVCGALATESHNTRQSPDTNLNHVIMHVI